MSRQESPPIGQFPNNNISTSRNGTTNSSTSSVNATTDSNASILGGAYSPEPPPGARLVPPSYEAAAGDSSESKPSATGSRG
jgi:hypothetical protein